MKIYGYEVWYNYLVQLEALCSDCLAVAESTWAEWLARKVVQAMTGEDIVL